MTLALQITYRNLDRSDQIDHRIRAEAAKLNKFYPRIESCRVVVEAPEGHHRHGNVNHVRIDLGVPGGELVTTHEPGLQSSLQRAEAAKTAKHMEVDAPHKSISRAIHDAFKSARRQLQDYVRRQRGDVKVHPQQRAQVSEVFPEQGYGFLETPDGRQVYFHKNSVLHGSFGRIKVGTTVSFAEEQGERGPQASTVTIVH